MESSGTAPVGETDNQRQARLRRERRNAKIQAGGSERLNKITSLSGRPAAAEADLARSPSPRATPQAQPRTNTPNGSLSNDPDEVDISQMFSRGPPETSPQDQHDLLRQMLASTGPQFSPNGGMDQQMPGTDDPMLQMLQQMLGGANGTGEGGLPPGLANMLGSQSQPPAANTLDYMWRIVHAIFALVLGLYAAFKLPFNGSEAARTNFTSHSPGSRVFWIFATTELILQSSRYFVDKGKLPSSGLLATIGQFLPEPYAGYVRTFGRYSIIWTTIVSDAMVVIFVLGCIAWWNGEAAL